MKKDGANPFISLCSEIFRGTWRRRDTTQSLRHNHSTCIFSLNVLTLTPVDFPGSMKVPVGDQPKDIEKLIRDMPSKYISKPAYIILAVTLANTDLANPDGLKWPGRWTPDGTGTIVALAKVDLM